jgi:hypothetical protein
MVAWLVWRLVAARRLAGGRALRRRSGRDRGRYAGRPGESKVRTLLRPLFSELEMIVREPNGEPKLMVILHGQAMRSLPQHRVAVFVGELIPGGRAWRRMPGSG